MWLTRAHPKDCWGSLICWLLLPVLLLRMGTRLAPDRAGFGPSTDLEKADAAGLLLAYGQLAMKCPVSWQLKHALALLLAVTWLALLCGTFMVFWLLNCLNWVLGA
jgi:hypothetical protein